jgi:transposase-like protein
MKTTDVKCPDCPASYRRVELKPKQGVPGVFRCSLCGRVLESLDGSKEVAYRLVMARVPMRMEKKRFGT